MKMMYQGKLTTVIGFVTFKVNNVKQYSLKQQEMFGCSSNFPDDMLRYDYCFSFPVIENGKVGCIKPIFKGETRLLKHPEIALTIDRWKSFGNGIDDIKAWFVNDNGKDLLEVYGACFNHNGELLSSKLVKGE